MGRGLSEQQRQVLAFGVAVNAQRNGGVPRPAVFQHEAWHVRGRFRMALADALPDVWRDAVLYAVGGMRPLDAPQVVQRRAHERVYPALVPGVIDRTVNVCSSEYVDPWFRWKPHPRNRSRQVSLMRAANALAVRGLLAFTCGPRPWRWCMKTDGPCGLSDSIATYWDRWGPWGWHVTREGFAVVGDAWRGMCPATVAAAVDVVRMRHERPMAVYAARAAEWAEMAAAKS